MKIGIDLRSLENGAQHRGIGRYATEIIQALSRVDHKNEYLFFVSNKSVKVPKFNTHRQFKYNYAYGRSEGFRSVKYIRIMYLTPKPLKIDKYNLDVFFHIDNSQPIHYRKTPVISVLYDLIPYIFTDMYQHVHFSGYRPGQLIGYTRLKLRWKINTKWLKNYAKATGVIAISEHSKKDLIKYVPGINPKRVVSIPLGPSQLPPVVPKPSKELLKIKLQNFVFYLGGADPRKGLVGLVKNFEDVWEKNPNTQLVMAGKEIIDEDIPETRNLIKVISESSRPKQVFRLGFVSDSDMRWLYKNALCFTFPSIYEGFGLPILEAFDAGCPVVTYDNSSLPEVAGKAAIIEKTGQSLAPAINRLIKYPELRKSLIRMGKKQVEKYSWDKTARATLKFLEDSAK